MAQRDKPAKKATPNKPARRSPVGWLKRGFAALLLLIIAFTAIYLIAGPSTRVKLERVAILLLDPLRELEVLPGPVSALLDSAYDRIPLSVGFYVDATDLSVENEHFLGGVPESKAPILVLRNKHYTNFFNESGKQSRCLAFRQTESASGREPPSEPRPDPRVPRLGPDDLTMGPWVAGTILPRNILRGKDGKDDSAEVTAFFPVEPGFLNDVWRRLLHKATREYPRRFGEVWIFTGPVVKPDSSKLSTGVYVPDGFYLIVVDRLDNGGLRALSFIVPTDAKPSPASSFLSNLATIEKYTGLRFFPALDGELAHPLRHWVAPKPW